MNPVMIVQIIQAAMALAQAGSEVYSFLSAAFERIQAAQAAGTDLTDADWAFIDQTAAPNIAKAKGYISVTAALAASPAAPTPQPAPAPAAPAENAAGTTENGAAGAQ